MLEQIKKENDIKKIPERDWPVLAGEIRDFLINKISVTGGHLGSNLGTVELTMALHLTLDLPGRQCHGRRRGRARADQGSGADAEAERKQDNKRKGHCVYYADRRRASLRQAS